MRQVELPAENVLKIEEGSLGYTGRAMAVKLAGEDVIVIARNLTKLDTVFNYIVADLHGGSTVMCERETLRTDRCPEVLVVAKNAATLDEEL
jgi:hypothetical protein